jgi:hypothetical protein
MGDWWMSNQTMERALAFAGYDVRHVWGNGTHNDTHAASVFPDAMRWLWRDWPRLVERKPSGNPVLKAILQEGSDWEIAPDRCRDSAFIAADPQGHIYASTTTRIAEDQTAHSCAHADTEEMLAFGPDGRGHSGAAEEKILGHGLRVRGLTVRNDGKVYATVETADGDGELWLISGNGRSSRLDKGLKGAAGLAFSPDGLWLMVTQTRSRWAMSYRVQADGTLDAGALFYAVATPGSEGEGEAGAIDGHRRSAVCGN